MLGVVSASSNFLVETVPSSSNSHSVAADSKRNLIFLPEVCTTAPPAPGIAGAPPNVGCDTNKTVATGNTVSHDVCGGDGGCIAVYRSGADEDEEANKDNKDNKDNPDTKTSKDNTDHKNTKDNKDSKDNRGSAARGSRAVMTRVT